MNIRQEIENCASKFKDISLVEMDDVQLMNRVDTKYAFSLAILPEILPHLYTDYQIVEIDHARIPSYESMYYDTDDYKFFKDHHNGRLNRFKVRFRTYVESKLTFFEIKHKTKGRTKKYRIKVSEIGEQLDEKQLEFAKHILQNSLDLKPSLSNSFHRITLVSKTFQERLTLDFDIIFSRHGEEVKYDQLVIAELKQNKNNKNSPFFKLMKLRQIRPYRLSKYCIGAIDLLKTEKLKYNLFREKLIKLKKINAHV